jgi:hypothetical protein
MRISRSFNGRIVDLDEEDDPDQLHAAVSEVVIS